VPELKELYALLLAWLAVAGVGAVVAWAVQAIVPGARTPFRPQRRRAGAWNGPLVAAAFLAFIILPGFLVPHLHPPALARWFYGSDVDAETAYRLTGVVAGLLALPLQIAVWCGLLAAAGAPVAPLGLARQRTAAEFVAAVRTWLVVTPAVYAVNFAVLVVYGMVIGKQPAEHPIIQAFKGGSLPAGFAVLLVAEAVLAAPVREELFFRGVIQPWLAGRPWGGDAGLALAALFGVMLHSPANVSLRDPESVLSAAAPALFVLAIWPLYRALDRWGGSVHWLPVRDPVTRRQAVRAIVGTAALFANFHANVWPTPIALFVLALGLGWLAYRTQSVVAPTIMHVLFNMVAFAEMMAK
jgi:Type II CAAX prenyl endopeptidase Rce1-like